MKRINFSIALLVASLAIPTQSFAQTADDNFYKGRTITIIVDGAGSYAVFARTIARDMPRFISGHPNMIVQLMPGAGGIVAGNYLFNAAPRDGTVIGGVHGNVLIAPLLVPDAVKFDISKFSWIGNGSHTAQVGFVRAGAPIKSLDDAMSTQSLMGGTSIGDGGVDLAMLGRDLFGFKFKIVTGYKTADEVELALDRGEIDGMFAHNWVDLKSQKQEWLSDHKIRIIVQHGFTRSPDLPDVPLLLDYAQDDLQRQVLGIEAVRYDMGLPYVAPPAIPAARLEILRDAFQATLADDEFLADLKQQNLQLDRPMSGEELADVAIKVTETPAASVGKLQSLFAGFSAGGK